MDEVISTKLRRLREEKGWTLKDAERASGVHLSYISAIENGRRTAGTGTLEKLSKAYNPSGWVRLKENLLKLQAEEKRARKATLGKALQTTLRDAVLEGVSQQSRIPPDLETEIVLLQEDGQFFADWDADGLSQIARIEVAGIRHEVKLTISKPNPEFPPDLGQFAFDPRDQE